MKKEKGVDSNSSPEQSKSTEDEEVAKKNNLPGIVSKYPPGWDISPSFINSTGTVIGGTISALDALNNTVIQFESQTVSRLLDAGLSEHLSKNIEPIKSELDMVKSQVQETRNSLSTLKGFLDNNATFLTNLISTEGRMAGAESLLASVSSRVEKLEQERTTNWNKNITIISVIIALISTCAAVIGTSLAIYLAFMN